jgi:hypothetical protein
LLRGPAQAQARAGIQGGVSLDPDQVYFGGHIETTPLVDRVRFRPNVDIGLGDDLTLIAFNFEFTYMFPGSRPWNLYAGAGPAINWYDSDFGYEHRGRLQHHDRRQTSGRYVLRDESWGRGQS